MIRCELKYQEIIGCLKEKKKVKMALSKKKTPENSKLSEATVLTSGKNNSKV